MSGRAHEGHLFLIGFMGVGKTTLGRELARRLELSFYDLDEQIEKRTGRRIPELFEERGEPMFREVETDVLREIARKNGPSVVATGGGTFILARNRDIIRSSGISIWLDVPVQDILERVGTGEQRPLWAGRERAMTLLERRLPYYRRADVRFHAENPSPEDTVDQLVRLLESRRLL